LQQPNELKAKVIITRTDEMVLANFMKAFSKADHNVTGDELVILGDTSKGFRNLQLRFTAALDNAAIAEAEKKMDKMPDKENKGVKRKSSRTKRKSKEE